MKCQLLDKNQLQIKFSTA